MNALIDTRDALHDGRPRGQHVVDEFEDAVNMLHVQCQKLENAQLLLQKAEWVRFLLFINQKTSS